MLSEVQSVVVVMSSSTTGLEASLLGACDRELRLVLFSPAEAQVPRLNQLSFSFGTFSFDSNPFQTLKFPVPSGRPLAFLLTVHSVRL